MQLSPTDRTTLHRMATRGSFERSVVDAILDEAIWCHVGFAVDGRPWVVPTVHARVGDRLYLHGAVANHMLRSLADGVEACVTVTLVDGLVLARSAFHHSVNYRSVMLFGVAEPVDDPDEQREALHALVEHVVPGRMADARPPTSAELRATLVLRLPIVEASAKVRAGGPLEEPHDLTLPVWAGELPVTTSFGPPHPDAGVVVPVPGYVDNYHRP